MAGAKTKTSSKKSAKNTSGKKANKSTAKSASNKKAASKKSTAKKTSSSANTTLDTLEQEVATPQITDPTQAKLEGVKKSLDKYKDQLLKRFEGYIMGIAVLPPPQEGQDPEKQFNKDDINVLVLVDDQDSVKMPKHQLHEKIQTISTEIATDIDKAIKPQILLLTDLWQHCYDAKYELLQMIAMSAILYDTGTLQAVKISEVHKQMTLKKFEKYIVSYVLSGSITQGKATPESDVDVFLVVDDTDVKKMSRTELKDKLRAIIYGMGAEAGQITGIQNKINIQIYILTDFWETLKDANPVIFTLLRSGVPLYDRGVFMPWKQLLSMGRVKPSPEAIEMFMQSGDQFMERINFKIRDIVLEDLFWALTTPSQAALMMMEIPPPTPKELPEVMKEFLVDKEELLEPEYIKIIDKVLKVRKEIEHGNKKKVTGKEMDELVKESDKYLKRIKQLFKEIETHKEQEKIVHMYEQMVSIIRDALKLDGVMSVDEKDILKEFNNTLIKKGHLPQRYKRVFEEITDAKKHYEAGRLAKQEVNATVKLSKELTTALIEHIQRKRGKDLERVRLKVRYGPKQEKFGEVVLLGKDAYIIENAQEEPMLTRALITQHGTLLDRHAVSEEDFEEAITKVSLPPQVFLKPGLFESIKQIFGEDAEILMNY
jgi:predicted nucleotidyltransferase